MTLPFMLYTVMLSVILLVVYLNIVYKNWPAALGWTLAWFFAMRNGLARGYLNYFFN